MRNNRVLAYMAAFIAFMGSVVGWWIPDVAVGMSAASALIMLAVAMNLKGK